MHMCLACIRTKYVQPNTMFLSRQTNLYHWRMLWYVRNRLLICTLKYLVVNSLRGKHPRNLIRKERLLRNA